MSCCVCVLCRWTVVNTLCLNTSPRNWPSPSNSKRACKCKVSKFPVHCTMAAYFVCVYVYLPEGMESNNVQSSDILWGSVAQCAQKVQNIGHFVRFVLQLSPCDYFCRWWPHALALPIFTFSASLVNSVDFPEAISVFPRSRWHSASYEILMPGLKSF